MIYNDTQLSVIDDQKIKSCVPVANYRVHLPFQKQLKGIEGMEHHGWVREPIRCFNRVLGLVTPLVEADNISWWDEVS